MALIETIGFEQATGELRQIYDSVIRSRGKLAAVHKIQSLNPRSILSHMDLYLTLMFGSSPLKRYQREMIAVVVSEVNRCEYCKIHHGEALQHYWKDEQRVARLAEDYTSVGLSEQDEAMCAFAREMTEHPKEAENGERIAALRAVGLDDRMILDLTLIASYFNFVNRLVINLGVGLERNPGGYKY